MTHSGGKPHNVGDRGQRFEVTFVDPGDDNKRKVLGWSNDVEGAEAMVRAIDAHPVWTSPEIRDRNAGGPERKL